VRVVSRLTAHQLHTQQYVLYYAYAMFCAAYQLHDVQL